MKLALKDKVKVSDIVEYPENFPRILSQSVFPGCRFSKIFGQFLLDLDPWPWPVFAKSKYLKGQDGIWTWYYPSFHLRCSNWKMRFLKTNMTFKNKFRVTTEDAVGLPGKFHRTLVSVGFYKITFLKIFSQSQLDLDLNCEVKIFERWRYLNVTSSTLSISVFEIGSCHFKKMNFIFNDKITKEELVG